MEKMKVRNVIIGKQFENSENYQKFINLLKHKKTKLYIVEADQKVKIEENLYFDILWPNSKRVINENNINNNSLVCKMMYSNISVLFTGDIEEMAEKAILEKYKSTNILEATILKVAHHGSKTSSTIEFLQAVNPKYAVISVGKNNKFGHPADSTLENLKKINCKIYRTDTDGEIMIKINNNIKIEKTLNNF